MGTAEKLYPDRYELSDITIIVFLGIIHHHVFYLKHKVLETAFYLCLQVETGPVGLN
jgi:hypothetical protein